MSEGYELHRDGDLGSFAGLTKTAGEIARRLPLSLTQPLFVLAPPRSHAAVISAMLGQHPQMYSLPETHLFSAPTIAGWWAACEKSTFRMADGLLRAVAQIFFGEQTDDSIKAAEGWLRRRSQLSTGLVFETLTERVSPRLLIESSSTVVSRPAALERLRRMFPSARFLHLAQHPRGFGEFLMNGIREASKQGPVPYWMLNLASFPGPSASEDGTPHRDAGFDPQRAWYVLNTKICEFLEPIRDANKMLIRVEDLFAQPRLTLQRIAAWFGLRTDEEAIEAMQYPERSPFACLGPSGARYGNESGFLRHPRLDDALGQVHSLEGPLSWRQAEQEFLPKVKELALHFGYK
jgi:hypothetical protein